MTEVERKYRDARWTTADDDRVDGYAEPLADDDQMFMMFAVAYAKALEAHRDQHHPVEIKSFAC